MKSIPVEQLDERLIQALEQQDEHEAILLTRNSGTVAWVLRVPEAMKDTQADVVVRHGGPSHHVIFVVQARDGERQQAGNDARTPVFGAGRGTLTILSEDDDHLKDFQEYME